MPDIKRIQKEDFEAEMRDTIDKLAYPLNSFMEQTKSALDGNLDFTNINQELITVDVTVDTDGIPTIVTKFKSTLNTKCAGVTCINALNLTSASTYPDGAPFCSTTESSGIVTINHVTGLQANNKYRLTLLSVGR